MFAIARFAIFLFIIVLGEIIPFAEASAAVQSKGLVPSPYDAELKGKGIRDKQKHKSFIIKRFILPVSEDGLSFYNTGGAYLLHTRETVGADGGYTQETQKVPHSKIIIDRCIPR